MEALNEQLAHLDRLASILRSQPYTAEVIRSNPRPYLKVANAGTPELNERIYCGQAEDSSWVFEWPWHQPIGSVDDLETAAGKITAVLRPVAGEA